MPKTKQVIDKTNTYMLCVCEKNKGISLQHLWYLEHYGSHRFISPQPTEKGCSCGLVHFSGSVINFLAWFGAPCATDALSKCKTWLNTRSLISANFADIYLFPFPFA